MSDQYDNCTSVSPSCPASATIYGYAPNLGANLFFAIFFGLTLVAHLAYGTYRKTWSYTIAICLGCLTELIGYIGRIILHYNAWSNTGFEMQICCLILAPAFLSAAIYLTLSNLIKVLGSEHARLKPSSYTWIFISADLFSLVLQGVGGGIAASANTDSMRNVGSDLMLTGIVVQVVSLLVFSILTVDYLIGVRKARNTLSPRASAVAQSSSTKLFAAGILVAFLAIFTRCVYRIPEMADGWASDIMQNEVEFIVLDGVMVTIAVLALTIVHPGHCFPELWQPKGVPDRVALVKTGSTSGSSLDDVEKGTAESK